MGGLQCCFYNSVELQAVLPKDEVSSRWNALVGGCFTCLRIFAALSVISTTPGGFFAGFVGGLGGLFVLVALCAAGCSPHAHTDPASRQQLRRATYWYKCSSWWCIFGAVSAIAFAATILCPSEGGNKLFMRGYYYNAPKFKLYDEAHAACIGADAPMSCCAGELDWWSGECGAHGMHMETEIGGSDVWERRSVNFCREDTFVGAQVIIIMAVF